jgi:iron(III) transport system ATP-binding protein
VQYSQDIGQASRIYNVGETLMLKPNASKINLFSFDGEKSLIQGVKYEA